jgi:1,4-alpha-glucan branching enzyme
MFKVLSRFLLLSLVLILSFLDLKAQVVTVSPSFPTESSAIVITFDAKEGNGGMSGFAGVVYAHTGVITNNSTSNTDWKYTKGTWGTANAPVLTGIGNDKYTLSISDIRAYYGVPSGESIEKIAILFRNEAGNISGRNADGSDIFIQLYSGGLYATIASPSQNKIYSIGESITINGGSSMSATLAVNINGTDVASNVGTSISYTYTATTPGDYQVILAADAAGTLAYDTVNYVINPSLVIEALPTGAKLGINRTTSTSLTLALFAPYKKYVYVIGDFNNWTVSTDYFMKRASDGATWWIEIPNLQANERYAFQYLVDGEIIIADPYSELVLDPNNDQYIAAETYPNPHPYPQGKTSGIASLIEMTKTPYTWEVSDFIAPEENKLIVYEMLVRDFVAKHNYKTLLDTLDYLVNLGINAIELMPINEFEGNESWGYNPSYHMALDKYYGTPASLKAFVDACHKRGIAVIVDVVYNHAFSQNPLCQLYWDATTFKPTGQNPFVNTDAKHDFNVGYDLNHESAALRAYLKQIMEYWLTEFKLDGFRFDLSKGFTQKNTLGNVGAWGAYDIDRVNNLKRIYNEVKSVNPNAYVILEHFADNSEEKDLANYGCMFWGNMNHEATEASMGYTSNFTNAYHQSRGWNNPKLLAYAESHDEERMLYKNLQYGNSSGSYSVKDINTALDRSELTWVIFSAIPGPKLMWQFQELGYDYAIDFNGRVGNKPIKWDYNTAGNRKDIYRVMSEMNQLKLTYKAFEGNDVKLDLGGTGKRVHLSDASQNFVVMGNFDVTTADLIGDFQHTGMWYEYFSGDSINVTDIKMSINCAPGAYKVYTDKSIRTSQRIGSISQVSHQMLIYPNPSQNELRVVLEKAQATNYSLVDAHGKSLKADVLQGNQSSFSIDISHLPSGVYFLQVNTNCGMLIRKIVK